MPTFRIHIDAFAFFLPEMIHNPQHYARDFYFFKRAQYPQLSLVHKKPAQAFLDLQRQCFLLKVSQKEISYGTLCIDIKWNLYGKYQNF